MSDLEVLPIAEVAGAYCVTSALNVDARGWFRDAIRFSELPTELAQLIAPEQVSISHSLRNAARGLHYSVTDAEEDYFQSVTCAQGRVTDLLVDLRLGSPTFRREFVIDLAPETGLTLLVPPGVGHGFRSLAESSTLVYTMSRSYPKAQTRGVRLDGLSDSFSLDGTAIMTERDRQAPTLSEALAAGALPRWTERSTARLQIGSSGLRGTE